MSAKNVLLGGSLIIAILLVGGFVVTATIMKFTSSSDDSITGLATSQTITVAQAYNDENEAEEEDESDDAPITGTALDKASTAALKYIGEGQVTDTETGDEEGYYEIEITLDDGREVDVHIDENFSVLGKEWEDEEED